MSAGSHGEVAGPGGARLHDIRYTAFRGEHLPRWTSVTELLRLSAGRALGARRSTAAKLWPWLLVVACFLPAVVAVGVPLVVGDILQPLQVLDLPALAMFTVTPTVAFAATVLPPLLTHDRRDRVLSLYFSTAVSAGEYLAGKVLAAVVLMLLVTLGPGVLLVGGDVLTADDPLDRLADDFPAVPALVLTGLAAALFHASIAMALGALTARRVLAVGGYLGLMLVTPAVAALAAEVTGEDVWLAADLLQLPARLAAWLHDNPGAFGGAPPPTAMWGVWGLAVAAGTATLALRYGRESR